MVDLGLNVTACQRAIKTVDFRSVGFFQERRYLFTQLPNLTIAPPLRGTWNGVFKICVATLQIASASQ